MTSDYSVGKAASLGLGIDAGGTQTRWALADSAGEIIGSGVGPAFSGMQMHSAAGQREVALALETISQMVAAHASGRVVGAVRAGVTGIGAGNLELQAMIGARFGLTGDRVALCSDIEIAWYAAFGEQRGYLVYAGTGSIAAFVDESGVLHRAGGRGVALDDAGGGYWIAREALRRIWRREDERPGAWRQSPMAAELFARVGGDSSIFSARYLMEQSRGEIGSLAVVVGASADTDPLARQILDDAGRELARLANAMTLRYGKRAVVLTGRCAALHPCIEQQMRLALLPGIDMEMRTIDAHVPAARQAAQQLP